MNLKRIELILESQLGRYLDSIYTFKYERTDFATGAGKVLQVAGVDFIIVDDVERQVICVDEKARLTQTNRDEMPTFVFELDYISRSYQLTQGWLFHPKQLTDRYHLITKLTTSEVTQDIYKTVYNNNLYDGVVLFTGALVRSIDKSSLIMMLTKLGLDEKRLSKHYRHHIRTIVHKHGCGSEGLAKIEGITGVRLVEPIVNQKNKITAIRVFVDELEGRLGWIHHTFNLIERPINLVLKDALLEKVDGMRILSQ